MRRAQRWPKCCPTWRRAIPGMRFRMIDEQDRIRRHVRVFVNSREAATLAEPVAAGDQVHLICALSGG